MQKKVCCIGIASVIFKRVSIFFCFYHTVVLRLICTLLSFLLWPPPIVVSILYRQVTAVSMAIVVRLGNHNNII